MPTKPVDPAAILVKILGKTKNPNVKKYFLKVQGVGWSAMIRKQRRKRGSECLRPWELVQSGSWGRD